MESRELGLGKPIFLNSLFLLLTVMLLVVAGTRQTFAQVDRAVLEGTVTDPPGSVIGGVSVKVRAVDTSLTESQPTNSKGYYRFPSLAVGKYEITASGTGFRTEVIDG